MKEIKNIPRPTATPFKGRSPSFALLQKISRSWIPLRRGCLKGGGCFLLLFLFFFLPSFASAATILTKPANNLGLVGYWTMDGKDINWTANTISDKSGNGNTGTIVSMSTTTSPTQGKIGQALKFNGLSTPYGTYVSVSDSTPVNLDITANMTVSMWVKGQGGSLLSTGLINNNKGFNLLSSAYNTGDIGIQRMTSGSNEQIRTSSYAGLSHKKWTHVVVSVSGSSVAIYVDSTSHVLFGSWSGSINSYAGTPFYIGTRQDKYGTFNGSIDDVRIYNRALSASEIAKLYKESQGKFATPKPSSLQSGLVGYWTMDGKDINWATGLMADKSGNGNNLNMVGMSMKTSPVVGKIGQAISFVPSINQYAENSSLSWPGGPITAAFWVNTPGGTEGGAFSVGSLFENRVGAHVTWSDNELYWDYGNTVIGRVSTSFASYLNKWTHVALVSNSTNFKAIYINGMLVNSGVLAADSGIKTGIIIGQYFGQHNGKIDDFRLYNRVLSAGEIKQLYALGQSKFNTSATEGLSNGLVGHWTFDGKDTNWATGVVADKSGNGNNGQMANMSTTTSPVIGKVGQGLRFDGTNRYVNIGTPASLSSLQVPMTITGWFKQSTATGLQPILGQYEAVGSSKLIKMVRIDSGVFKYYSSVSYSAFQSSGTITPDVGKWHFFSVTVSGDTTSPTVVIKIDGTSEIFAYSAMSTTPDTTVKTYIGGDMAQTNERFNGVIDDVRVYNRALSVSEVQQLYKMGR